MLMVHAMKIYRWDALDESHVCCLSVIGKFRHIGVVYQDGGKLMVTPECQVCGVSWHKVIGGRSRATIFGQLDVPYFSKVKAFPSRREVPDGWIVIDEF